MVMILHLPFVKMPEPGMEDSRSKTGGFCIQRKGGNPHPDGRTVKEVITKGAGKGHAVFCSGLLDYCNHVHDCHYNSNVACNTC